MSDRLTRGMGPCWSRSIKGISGAELRGLSSPRIKARHVSWYTSASASLITASPSKSAVKASWRPRRAMHGLSRLVGRRSGDELPGHDARGNAHRLGQQSRALGAGRGQSEAHGKPPGHAIAGLGQVFRQVATDRVVRLQGRQHVDEPEKLNADQGVIERCRDEPLFPPGALPWLRAAADPREELAANLLGPRSSAWADRE